MLYLVIIILSATSIVGNALILEGELSSDSVGSYINLITN